MRFYAARQRPPPIGAAGCGSDKKVEGHATWVNKIDAANARFVPLWVATESQSTFMLEWPSSELAAHSLDKLRMRLEDKRRQRKATRRQKQ
jgi:hypothetical protein